MPDLLLELFSEEIPARMQGQASADLKRLVTDALVARGLLYEGAVALATPRRLALHIAGLPARQPDTREEKRGPRVGAPQAAIDGFLKSAGLASITDAQIVSDPKKGDSYVAVIERAGGATLDVLAEILPGIIRTFPWPKSMRWGAASLRSDSLRWVRPLQSIVATFGPDTEDPDVVPFEIDGIVAGNITYGHRFLAPDAIKVRRFDDYVPSLERAKVVLDPARRRDIILHDAKDLAFAQGLTLVEDDGLLDEVAGLVEWPRVLMGSFGPAFLAIPPEVIRATIRANQKCFVLRDAKGALANRFILVSNLEASDGGAAIVAGNERVVAARLSDAKFFWESDLRIKLEDRLPKLEKIIFHEKLGTQAERVKRIEALARELASLAKADPDKAARAAHLAKADLVSEMVGEFPELQGLMGRYYASAQGEDSSVAAALEEHYKPQGPSDNVPRDPVSIAVALADKIDTLVGFWAIDEKPTGSKDPYALRRAALGVIRLVLENDVRVNLCEKIAIAALPILEKLDDLARQDELETIRKAAGILETPDLAQNFENSGQVIESSSDFIFHTNLKIQRELLDFFHDRLRVLLRDQGQRHDLVSSVLSVPAITLGMVEALGGELISPVSANAQDDLLMIVRRINALSAFLDTDDGKSLVAGYKRAANILRAEEKKDGTGAFSERHAPNLRSEPAEHQLAAAIDRARNEVTTRVAQEDFAGAMHALAKLRAPVDQFFTDVTVNADDPRTRKNRLQLLGELREAMHAVADFSKIAG